MLPYRARARFVWLFAIIVCFNLEGTAAAQDSTFLVNGSFEQASSQSDNAPAGWWPSEPFGQTALVWDDQVSVDGLRSVRIDLPQYGAGTWRQNVVLPPDRNFLFSGWIRTRDIVLPYPMQNAGAYLFALNRNGTGMSEVITGTTEWTWVRLAFNSGPDGSVQLTAGIGAQIPAVKGTAWFDDLRLTAIDADDPHPPWKILALIYQRTDFQPSPFPGEVRYVGYIDDLQLAEATAAVTRFALEDIPALTSGNMVPELTIRYPGTLTELKGLDGGYWPAPHLTASDLDPGFDSVIVIWQPNVVDLTTGEPRWIGNAAGLTADTGRQQAYTTLIVDAATGYGHRNVFKHEWGHSVLFFYGASGTAPRPSVENHTYPFTYVHCGTGEDYIWLDETDEVPVPNSIYHNASGFTHDYYSGSTALASNPTHCLGITPEAWAAGGPVSRPGQPPASSDRARLDALRLRLDRLTTTAEGPPGRFRPLETSLEAAMHAIDAGDRPGAIEALVRFRHHVSRLLRLGRLDAWTAETLAQAAVL
jgi:hypothetical protein